jgi:G:T-mismatch repair DNA endonuclease (very short patch repair protein)
MNNIKCRLCDDIHNVKQFGMHVSRIHKIKYEDYAKLYWEDLPNWSPCRECGEICKSVYCSKQCTSIGFSKMRKGSMMPPRTEEHIHKLSQSAKERLKDKTKHPMYGKTHKKESIEKVSNTQKKRLKDKTKHPMYGKTHTTNSIDKMSKFRNQYYVENDQYLKGKTYREYFGNERAGEIIKKIFQNKPMNKLEKRVADYLDGFGIDYTFQFFINADGVCKSYDFKIKNSNIILEIHGDYWHGGSGVMEHVFNVNETIENDKLKQKIASDRGYDVVVIWESEIKENIDIVKERLNL